jgi:hypothetical protein
MECDKEERKKKTSFILAFLTTYLVPIRRIENDPFFIFTRPYFYQKKGKKKKRKTRFIAIH